MPVTNNLLLLSAFFRRYFDTVEYLVKGKENIITRTAITILEFMWPENVSSIFQDRGSFIPGLQSASNSSITPRVDLRELLILHYKANTVDVFELKTFLTTIYV